ncbi:hypothetical protein K461DRAFT_181454 [Myriangium duriaei CBS 260.36]|uniref:Uncharacterized protein n=1 Tax=Myriangium duriaei CBS 260.36 TaxID=1168546 RepID=A0A9P4MF62_9PEZI|nr:hypothetical protein K461DRAFT_181454 [Myriangium duriaei CBS 260.36]
MAYDDRRRRPLYAPPSRSRSTLSTYAPLILTVTIATAGALAWIWADRLSSPDDDDDNYPPRRDQTIGVNLPPPSQGHGQEGLSARVNAAWQRSPSPAQLLNSAGQVVSAGVAAASSAVGLKRGEEVPGSEPGRSVKGKRVASGRDDGFSDHERWSEEAAAAAGGQKRKAVAVVVSAEHDFAPMEGDPSGVEHTSILSHLVPSFNPATTDLFILIFAPRQSHALSSLQAQAAALLPNAPAQILPFATPTGYVHMLRHLAPSLAYVADTPALAGQGGETIASLRGWVGQTVVVVGDDGAGGLVDTETETEDEGRGKGKSVAWYEGSDIVGLGKGVEIVDVRRVADDWVHRVGGN